MANETITFSCPACGIKLTVPSTLKGVSGPCPSCGTQIQAPNPGATAPREMPAPPPPITPPPPAGASESIPSIPPPRQATQPPATTVLSEPATTVLKPEARQLPKRQYSAEALPRPMPVAGDSGNFKNVRYTVDPRYPYRTSLFKRFAMVALFLLGAGVLLYCVVNFSKPKTAKDLNPASMPDSPKVQPAPEETPPPKDDTKPPATGSLPAQSVTPPTPALPPLDDIEVKLPGVKAQEVLEKFLTAKSLAERRSIIETKTPEAELAAGCLAGPLPPAPIVVPEDQQTNELEQFVDFYFSVTFETDPGSLNKQAILVRTRGKGDPKVIVDPFLDLYGGRLAKFVATPTDQAGVFQVIVDPVATCLDPKIPNGEKKLTLKLLPCDGSKEIALAFFGRVSEIAEMLNEGTHRFNYGRATACTVSLKWNSQENPEHPYLEAVQLMAFDWNP